MGTSNETREILFRSGVNLAQTFNTGPNGESLEGHADLKSKFKFYMGQENVEAQIAELVEKYPQMKESLLRMETDRREGQNYNPVKTLHADKIRLLLRNAKRKAWTALLNDEQIGTKAQVLQELHSLGKLADEARVSGNYKNEARINKEIERIKNIPK